MTGRNYKIEHSEIRRSAGGQTQNRSATAGGRVAQLAFGKQYYIFSIFAL